MINLSTDKAVTSDNLSLTKLKLSLGPPQGSKELRERIAGLYNQNINASHVHATNGTTGANSLVFQTLLAPGDHVIAMYPSYAQLVAMPRAIVGVEMSYWTLDLENQVKADIKALKDLIKPKTTMIVLNSPNNPTGMLLAPDVQEAIISLAQEHNITIVVDEIFRPLYHDKASTLAPSFVEHPSSYDKIVVTGSLSKAWGLSGARIGWVVTRNAEFMDRLYGTGLYTIQAVSTLDEKVAIEALSDRCRPQILAKHLGFAQQNLDLLQAFIDEHKDRCSWTRPNAGATAFVKFSENGAPMDDVEFCLKLKNEKGVLLSPGSLCFGKDGRKDFRGYVRMHITVPPEVMQAGLDGIGSLLRQ